MDARSEENHQGHEIRDDAGARRKPVGLPQLSDSTPECFTWIQRKEREEYWRGCWRDEIQDTWASLMETPKEGKDDDDPPTRYLGKEDEEDDGEEPDEPNKSISVDRFTLKLAGEELKTMEIPAKRWLTNAESERPFTEWGSDEWKEDWKQDKSEKIPPTEPERDEAKPELAKAENAPMVKWEMQTMMAPTEPANEELQLTPKLEVRTVTPRIEELVIKEETIRKQISPMVEELRVEPEKRLVTLKPVVEELQLTPDRRTKMETPKIEELIVSPEISQKMINPVIEELRIEPERKLTTLTPVVEAVKVTPDVSKKTITPVIEELKVEPETRLVTIDGYKAVNFRWQEQIEYVVGKTMRWECRGGEITQRGHAT